MSDERLQGPVYFKNGQWAVTEYGVESVPPASDYHFHFRRISELSYKQNGTFYWPVHLAEKTWVDIEAFIQAFMEAIKIHDGKFNPPIDPNRLSVSLAEARRIAMFR